MMACLLYQTSRLFLTVLSNQLQISFPHFDLSHFFHLYIRVLPHTGGSSMAGANQEALTPSSASRPQKN